jgi:hypothetical protein
MLSSLLLGSLGSGCQRISGAIDSFRFECDDPVHAPDEQIRYFYAATYRQEPVSGAALAAKWQASDQAEARTLKVSGKGCVAVPREQGVLKIFLKNGEAAYREAFAAAATASSSSEEVRRINLIAMKQPAFGISCGRMLTTSLTLVPVQFSFKNFSVEDHWQLEKITLLRRKAGDSSAPEEDGIELTPQAALQGANLLNNGDLKPADGAYELRAVASTIDGRTFSGDTTCSFELDQTAPTGQKLLHKKLHDQRKAMQLLGFQNGIRQLYCIAPQGQAAPCQNPAAYQPASSFIAVPGEGEWTFYSYTEDQAGNRSAVTTESFYVDHLDPELTLSWLSPVFKREPAFAPEPNHLYRLHVQATDDSSRSEAADEALNLASVTECRVELAAPTGTKLAGFYRQCSGDACRDAKFNEWYPCSGEFAFRLMHEVKYLDHLMTVQARVHDTFGRQTEAMRRLWINGAILGQWNLEKSAALALMKGRDLFFAKDQVHRLIALAPLAPDKQEKNRRVPFQLLFRDIDPVVEYRSDTWNGPFSFTEDAALEYGNYSLPNMVQIQLIATPKLSQSQSGSENSLWLLGAAKHLDSGKETRGLFEIILPNEAHDTPRNAASSRIKVRFHPLPADLNRYIGMNSGISAADMIYDHKSRVIIIRDLLDRQGIPVFLCFDGTTYTRIGLMEEWQGRELGPLFYLPSIVGHYPLQNREKNDDLALVVAGKIALLETRGQSLSYKYVNLFNENEKVGAIAANQGALFGYFVGPEKDHAQSYQFFQISLQDKAGPVLKRSSQPFMMPLREGWSVSELELNPYRDHLSPSRAGGFWLSAYTRNPKDPLAKSLMVRQLYEVNLMQGENIHSISDLWGMSAENGALNHGQQYSLITDFHGQTLVSGAAGVRSLAHRHWIDVTKYGSHRMDVYENRIERVNAAVTPDGEVVQICTTQDGRLFSSTALQPQETPYLRGLKSEDELKIDTQYAKIDVQDVDADHILAKKMSSEGGTARYLLIDRKSSVVKKEYVGGETYRMINGALIKNEKETILMRNDDGSLEPLKRHQLHGQIVHWNHNQEWIAGTHEGLYVYDYAAQRVQDLTFGLHKKFNQVAIGTNDVLLTRVASENSNGFEWYWLVNNTWLSWPEEHYPRFPSWHRRAGELVVGSSLLDYELDPATGDLWIRIYSDGTNVVGRFHNNQWSFFSKANAPFEGEQYKILIDRNGHVFVSTSKGLYLFQP